MEYQPPVLDFEIDFPALVRHTRHSDSPQIRGDGWQRYKFALQQGRCREASRKQQSSPSRRELPGESVDVDVDVDARGDCREVGEDDEEEAPAPGHGEDDDVVDDAESEGDADAAARCGAAMGLIGGEVDDEAPAGCVSLEPAAPVDGDEADPVVDPGEAGETVPHLLREDDEEAPSSSCEVVDDPAEPASPVDRHEVDPVDPEAGALSPQLARAFAMHVFAVPAATTVDISWNIVNVSESLAANGATTFEVETKLATSLQWTPVYYGSAESYLLSGLAAGTHVDIRVRAVGLAGKNGGPCEARISTRTLPGSPGTPSALAALTVWSRKIELGWGPPVHDGGSSITGYRLQIIHLQQSPGASKRNETVIFCSTTDRFVVEGLTPGASYRIQVRAFNVLGSGPYSKPIELETLPAPPARPKPPAVTDKTSTSISLSWSFPACNGASVETFELQMTVLGYGEKRREDNSASEIHRSPSHSTSSSSQGTSDDGSEDGVVLEARADGSGSAFYDIYRGPSNEFNVTKLRPFTSYAFRVQALNAAGASGYSAYTICASSPAPPAAPLAPALVGRTPSSLTLKWEVPQQDNGAPVLRYTLEMLKAETDRATALPPNESWNYATRGGRKKKSPGKQDVAAQHSSAPAWEVVYDGHGLRSQITGLARGKEYEFRVKAQNAVGASSPSPVSKAQTLATAPNAPLPPTFTKVSPASVLVKWASPACDNGLPVISFKLLLNDGRGGPLRKVYEGAAKSFNATKLVPALRYRAAVQAINGRGASDLSEVAEVELPAAVSVELPRTPPPLPTPIEAEFPSSREKKPALNAAVTRKNEKKKRAPPAIVASKKEKEVRELLRQARQAWYRKAPGTAIWTCVGVFVVAWWFTVFCKYY